MGTQAPRQDLLRVRSAWEDCQASRDRNAIYGYLAAVFDLVMWWKAEYHAVGRAHRALWLQGADSPTTDEPFAAITRCTSDPGNVDKQTRSKWSRVLRYAAEYKTNAEPLAGFWIRPAEGRHQQMCLAVYPMSRATRSELSVKLYRAWMR